MPARPVRLILDASAMVAYVRESIHVGEVIAEIDGEEAGVGLPVLCLAQARTVVDDVDRLDLLAGHDAAVVLPDPDDWQALAATVDLVGRWDAAAAALLALDLDVPVLTSTQGLYDGLGRWGPDHRHLTAPTSAFGVDRRSSAGAGRCVGR